MSSNLSEASTSKAPPNLPKLVTPRYQDEPSFAFPDVVSPTSPGLRRSSFTNHLKPGNRARGSQDVRGRSRIGFQNMMNQCLQELHSRPSPPSVFDALQLSEDGGHVNVLDSIVESVKGAVKLKEGSDNANRSRGPDEYQEDAEGKDVEFNTRQTHHLLTNLLSIIKQSDESDAYVFYEVPSDGQQKDSGKSASPFRRSRNSLSPSGRRTRSPSPTSDERMTQGSELLLELLTLLASIVSEDCRYKYHPFSLLHPPRSLQALVIDIARFLLSRHRNDPQIIFHLTIALLPAFNTFGREMHVRLLAFFEEVLLSALEHTVQVPNVAELDKSLDDPFGVDLQSPTQHPIVSIQVEEVDDDSTPLSNPRWAAWSTSSPSYSLASLNAPFHPISVYYTSSLLSNLLATILDAVDISPDSHARLETTQRLYRLVGLLHRMKPDVYLDLLHVTASQSHNARYAATSILMTLWPSATSHAFLSCALPTAAFPPEAGVRQYDHQFVPWCYRASALQSLPHLSQSDCHICTKPLHEFGLHCSQCQTTVHFGCYDPPDGCYLAEYHSGASNVQRVAMHRFSDVLLPQGSPAASVNHHSFRRTNLFTLSLCVLCHLPLWGCFAQSMRCTSCMTLAHPSCLRDRHHELNSCRPNELNSETLIITWDELRQSCVKYYDILSLRPDDLATKSYEELDVFLSMLWIQKQILDNGLAMGTVVVRQKGKVLAQHEAGALRAFELHHIISSCEDIIANKAPQVSPAMDDYLGSGQLKPSQFLLVCEWSILAYISCAIKSPQAAERPPVGLTLNIPSPVGPSGESSMQPKEIVSLAHMRDILGYDFGLYSDTAAKHVLGLLHLLGFFGTLNQATFDADLFSKNPMTTLCVFPLPLGLDLSADVETLFSSVEASLSDLDLSLNEFGFLLLTRRLWPNSLMSEYALTRLCRIVVVWIVSEDTSLATILRDYIARRRRLPGVRPSSVPAPWPSPQSHRTAPVSSTNNGGDYVAARRAMLSRYARRWLRTLHDQNPQQYALTLYQISNEISKEEALLKSFSGDTGHDGQTTNVYACDRTLVHILGLSRASVTFTVFDDMFVYWLESLLSDDVRGQVMPSLSRLLPRETDSSQRPSTIHDGNHDLSNFPIEPWKVLNSHASESVQGLSRPLQWLLAFARSGVDIPMSTLKTVGECVLHFDVTFMDSFLLIKVISLSLWLKSLGRQSLQQVLAVVIRKFTPKVLDNLAIDADSSISLQYLRYCLAACLILYGCDRQAVISLGFLDQNDMTEFHSRRKLATRAEEVADPIIIDRDIMDALDLCIRADIDAVSNLVIRFLFGFFTKSLLVESYEVDNFILRNGDLLCTCIWRAYSVTDASNLPSIRPALLLRVLVVDDEPFQRLLEDVFQPSTHLSVRLDGVHRIFRIILDVLDSHFVVEGRQWRACISKAFQTFFSTLWLDDKEEIRIVTQSLCKTMLPAHLTALTLFWTEALTKAPVTEQIALVSFLVQLHPHFIEWQLFSWDVIFETLVESGEYDGKEFAGDGEDGVTSSYLAMSGLQSERSASPSDGDSEMTALRTSLLLLSLRMIADGTTVDQATISRLKLLLVQAIGATDVSPRPYGDRFGVRFDRIAVIPDYLYPCIGEVVALLDSPFRVLSPSSTFDTSRSSTADLVGAPFSDILVTALCTLDDLSNIPVLVLKTLIEGLSIIIHKQDLEEGRLKYLQQPLRNAIVRLLDVLLDEGSYEVRQIALSVVQAFIKKCSNFMGNIVILSVEKVAKLIATQSHHGASDLLVVQARQFLETTLATYSNGLFVNICRRPIGEEFFVVIKQLTGSTAKPSTRYLRESLLRDTLSKASESDRSSFQQVIKNLQTYVEVVHHQNYSADLMRFTGQYLVQMARRASDGAAEALDASPLLTIAAKLMQHNKLQSRDMFTYTETILRVLLNRLEIPFDSLFGLIQVTSTLVKKTQQSNLPGQAIPNSMVQIIFEILGDGLRIKSRVHPSTIAAMLEVIMTPDAHGHASLAKTHVSSFLGLVDSGLHFLAQYNWAHERVEKDFNASIAVAKMILEASTLDRNIMLRLSEHASEKSNRNGLSVRGWNVMVLAAMTEPTGVWEQMVFSQLGTFSVIHQATLLALIQSGGPIAQHARTEVNYAYISIKLWLLLAHRVSLRSDGEAVAWLVVWSELWTPFENLVGSMEVDEAGHLAETLSTTWNLVADMLFFVNSLRCPLGAATSSIVALLKQIQTSGQASASSTKINRALKSMTEPPPEPALEVLVSQSGKDIIAEEKLRAAWERDNNERKGAQDKYRREYRNVT